jgi:hypothetical protein
VNVMLSNSNKECGFEHEIVSYMYDELGAAERTQFETHLMDCTSCTDEFAAVSFSRFSVFEWHKEEFAHLATPEIVIPYEPRKVAVESGGWFAGFSEIFAFARSPLAIGTAFAVLLGIGFVGFTLVGTGGNELASNIVVPPVVIEQKIESPMVVGLPVSVVGEDPIATDEVRPVIAGSRQVRPKVARQISPSRRVVEDRSVPNPTRQARRTLVLSDLGDDDEDSLRLSDMFDEIGG